MIKVLHIIAVPVKVKSSEGKIGVNGPERRMANISHLWINHDVDVHFMYPSRGNLFNYFSKDSSKYCDFEINSKFDVKAIFKIANYVNKHNINIIHTHGPGSLDLIASIAVKISGAKIIVSRPSFIDDLTNISKGKKLVYKIFDWVTYRMVDMMTLVSKNGYERAPLKRKKLIHNGIDLSKFTPVQHTSKEEIQIAMVAQLKKGKGWDDFIEIIEQLSKSHKIKGHIFGDGILRSELEKKIKKNNTQELFVFHGNIENVNEGLKDMDIFLFTSYREGLSVAVLESMAMGLPIVATQVGGIDEQVETKLNGFKHIPGDISGMVESLTKLIKSQKLRESFGSQSRKLAEERFDQQKMLKEYVDAYTQISKKNRRFS